VNQLAWQQAVRRAYGRHSVLVARLECAFASSSSVTKKVVELWREAGIVLRPGDEREGIKLKIQRDPDLFLVAEDDQQILGVVLGAWDGRRGLINHLAVREGYKRSRMGRSLVRELERRLIGKGALKVNAQIYKSNGVSLEFFKSLNYEVQSDLIMVGRNLKH